VDPLAVLFLVVLGSTTGLFEPFSEWVDDLLQGQVGEAVGALVLLAVGLPFAIVQGWSSRRESTARHQAESRFRRLVEQMPAVISTWDPRRDRRRPHPRPGTGIGLSLVAMFADLHGGRGLGPRSRRRRRVLPRPPAG